MADTPWRGTPEFDAAVTKWAEESGLPIEEARSQLDDIYRAAPEFGPSKIVQGPTPHRWRGAVEKSLRGTLRDGTWTGTAGDLSDLLDDMAAEGIDINKELEEWGMGPHLDEEAAKLEREMARANTPKIAAEWESQRQSLLKASEGLDRLDDSRIKSNFLDDFLMTRPLRGGPGDPPQGVFAPTYTEEMRQEASAKWKEIESRAASEGVDLKTAVKRAYVEMAEQIPRVHSDHMPPPSLVEDPARAARLKDIEAAAERQFPKKPATPDWASRMPDRLSGMEQPSSMSQYMKGPIERSLREGSNVSRMATPMPATPSAPPTPPSLVTRVGSSLPRAARTAGSAIGGALYDLGPPIGGSPVGTAMLSATTPKAGEGSDVVTPEDIKRSKEFWEEYDARHGAGLSRQVRANPTLQLPVYGPQVAGAQ